MKAGGFACRVRVVGERMDGGRARMAHGGTGTYDRCHAAVVLAARVFRLVLTAVFVLVTVMIRRDYRTAVLKFASCAVTTAVEHRRIDLHPIDLGHTIGMHHGVDG